MFLKKGSILAGGLMFKQAMCAGLVWQFLIEQAIIKYPKEVTRINVKLKNSQILRDCLGPNLFLQIKQVI